MKEAALGSNVVRRGKRTSHLRYQPLHVAMHDVVLPAVPKPCKVLPERQALRRLGSNRCVSAPEGTEVLVEGEWDVHRGLARDPRESLGDVFPRGTVGGNLNVLPRGLKWVIKHPTCEGAEVLKRDERDVPIIEGKSPHRCPVLSLKRYKELSKTNVSTNYYLQSSSRLTPPDSISMHGPLVYDVQIIPFGSEA